MWENWRKLMTEIISAGKNQTAALSLSLSLSLSFSWSFFFWQCICPFFSFVSLHHCHHLIFPYFSPLLHLYIFQFQFLFLFHVTPVTLSFFLSSFFLSSSSVSSSPSSSLFPLPLPVSVPSFLNPFLLPRSSDLSSSFSRLCSLPSFPQFYSIVINSPLPLFLLLFFLLLFFPSLFSPSSPPSSSSSHQPLLSLSPQFSFSLLLHPRPLHPSVSCSTDGCRGASMVNHLLQLHPLTTRLHFTPCCAHTHTHTHTVK